MDESNRKTCRKCGADKPISEFRRHHTGIAWGDPYRKDCKACMSEAKPKLPADQKRCRQCGEVKPKTLDYFRSNGGKQPGLFKPVCKACTNLPAPLPVPEGMKRCTKCQEVKPATIEYFHQHSRGGLRPACISCLTKQARAWVCRNPEKVLAIQRRQNVLVSSDPVRRERRANVRRESYRRNPYRILANQHQRRVLLRNSPTKFTKADVDLKFKQQEGKCYWCGEGLKEFDVDHIIAITKGGTNGPENICCSCPTCNNRKYNKMPWEFNGRLL